MKRLLLGLLLTPSYALFCFEPHGEPHESHVVHEDLVRTERALEEQHRKFEEELKRTELSEAQREQIHIRQQELAAKERALETFRNIPEHEITPEILREQEKIVEDTKQLIEENKKILDQKLSEQFVPAQEGPAQTVSGFERALARVKIFFLERAISVAELFGSPERAAKYRDSVLDLTEKIGDLKAKIAKAQQFATLYTELGRAEDAFKAHSVVVDALVRTGNIDQGSVQAALAEVMQLLDQGALAALKGNPLEEGADELEGLLTAIRKYVAPFGLVLETVIIDPNAVLGIGEDNWPSPSARKAAAQDAYNEKLKKVSGNAVQESILKGALQSVLRGDPNAPKSVYYLQAPGEQAPKSATDILGGD